jgi:hypothetical protein
MVRSISAARTIAQYHEVASAMAFELNFRPFLELKETMMIKIKVRKIDERKEWFGK